jgi:hypothetical protein
MPINWDALTSDIWAPDIALVVLSETGEASQADTVSCGSVSGSGFGQYGVSSECESCGCENSQVLFRGRHGCENSGLLCQICGYERLAPTTPVPHIAEHKGPCHESIPASFCRWRTVMAEVDNPAGPGPCLSHTMSPFPSPGAALSQDEVHVRAFDNASSWDEQVNRELRLEWEANGGRVVRSMQSRDSVTIRNQSEEWMHVSIVTDATPRQPAPPSTTSARPPFDNFDQEAQERPGESPLRRKQSVREPEATHDIPNKVGHPQVPMRAHMCVSARAPMHFLLSSGVLTTLAQKKRAVVTGRPRINSASTFKANPAVFSSSWAACASDDAEEGKSPRNQPRHLSDTGVDCCSVLGSSMRDMFAGRCKR